MKPASLLLCVFLCITCAGCTSKEQVYEHLYSGVTMRERMEQHPVDLPLQDNVSYDRYTKEKNPALNKEPSLPLPAYNME